MIDIDKLILSATKERDIARRESYKMVKSKFQEWKTSKENAGKKEMTDADQIKILKKLKAEYEADASMYRTKMSGQDIAKQYEETAVIIGELIPAEASEADIEAYISEIVGGSNMQLKDVICATKAKFPSTDGKIIATLAKKHF